MNFLEALKNFFTRTEKKSKGRGVVEDKPRQEPRRKNAGANNHNVGESKKRRKMAVASNRVNRARIKKWKY